MKLKKNVRNRWSNLFKYLLMLGIMLSLGVVISLWTNDLPIHKKEEELPWLENLNRQVRQLIAWVSGKEEQVEPNVNKYLTAVCLFCNEVVTTLMKSFSYLLLTSASIVKTVICNIWTLLIGYYQLLCNSSSLISAKDSFMNNISSEHFRIIRWLVMVLVAVCIFSFIYICIYGFRSHERGHSEKENKRLHSRDVLSSTNSGKKNHEKKFKRSCLLRFFIYLVIMFILISIPWEFVRLYQHAAAEKAALTFQGIPPECLPKEMSHYESVKSWFVWQLSWNHSPCEEYHKALLVDPFWEVTPLMVLSSAFTRCFMKPLEIVCSTLGRCFKLIFSEIPAQWQPIIMFITTLLTIVITIMYCSYRVHLPFLFKIEPSTPVLIKMCSKKNIKLQRYQGKMQVAQYDVNNYDVNDSVLDTDSSMDVG